MKNHSNENSDKRHTVFGLDKKRAQVIEMLNKALTDNDLDIGTYEVRFEIAQYATSVEELENAIYDFPNASLIFPHLTPKYTASPIPYASTSPQLLTKSEHKSNFWNILGRKHIAMPDLRSTGFITSTGLGETIIDLREMSKYCSEITIQNYNLLGSVIIKVSPNTVVRKQATNILGETTEKIRNKADKNLLKALFKPKPIVPVVNYNEPVLFVNILGINILGEIKIQYEQSEGHQYQS